MMIGCWLQLPITNQSSLKYFFQTELTEKPPGYYYLQAVFPSEGKCGIGTPRIAYVLIFADEGIAVGMNHLAESSGQK
jgi:hypothetical protein